MNHDQRSDNLSSLSRRKRNKTRTSKTTETEMERPKLADSNYNSAVYWSRVASELSRNEVPLPCYLRAQLQASGLEVGPKEFASKWIQLNGKFVSDRKM